MSEQRLVDASSGNSTRKSGRLPFQLTIVPRNLGGYYFGELQASSHGTLESNQLADDYHQSDKTFKMKMFIMYYKGCCSRWYINLPKQSIT
jgi:hypothetical protein